MNRKCLAPTLSTIVLSLACLALAAPPAEFPETADTILAKSKAAMGGAAWDGIKSALGRSKITAAGMNGKVESLVDILTGRYVNRFELGPMSGAEGFDGKRPWSQDSSGLSRPEEGEANRQAAADEAYRQANAWWYPQRWPAEVRLSGEKREGARRFYVLRITPRDGRPFDLWVDAGSYLFDRIEERGDIETRWTHFSDYRTVQGLMIPYATRSTNGDAKFDQLFALQTIELNVPVDPARFELPAAPAEKDYTLPSGKTSTTVPFELINNHIYLQARLNGKGPFRFLCDTGGANVVSPAVVAALGLKAEGALQARGAGEKSEDFALAKVQALQVGDATLSDQLFVVMPFELFTTVEDVAADGLIGYEVFKRFVVRVEYEQQRLILTEPAAFSYQGSGTVIPFKFNEHIPQVDGELDGIPGKFDIDTGSRASLDILAAFAEKHDLKKRYRAKLEAVTGWGVGGPVRSLVVRPKLLQLGAARAVRVENLVAQLSLQKQGAFSSQTVAGNVGAGVLKRFNIVFDYPGQRLIFEPNRNYALPDTADRAGMWLNRSAKGLQVVDVTRGGPAETAGLKAGNVVLAVDGTGVDRLTLPDLRGRLRGDPPGTKVRLQVHSGEKTREVTLVLRDLW